jgi:NAD(P)-dependent dehydrogenase (short-subunit alcohol dehydrogenase family)
MAEFSPYCASKHAIIGYRFLLRCLSNSPGRLTLTAAREYAKKNIRINAVAPATTATPMVKRFTARWPGSLPFLSLLCSVHELQNGKNIQMPVIQWVELQNQKVFISQIRK